MKILLAALLVAIPAIAFCQKNTSCETAPTDAMVTVPQQLEQWFSIVCGQRGHILVPAKGFVFKASSNSRSISFPALGLGGVPAYKADGVSLVLGRSGSYAPLLGANLMSPHDAYFPKSRVVEMAPALLEAANSTASEVNGYEGPYKTGFLYDLLSNQGFEYRLYVLMKGGMPHLIIADFESRYEQPKQVTLIVQAE